MMAVLPFLLDQGTAKNGRSRARSKAQRIERANKQRYVALFEQAKLSKECVGITSEELVH